MILGTYKVSANVLRAIIENIVFVASMVFGEMDFYCVIYKCVNGGIDFVVDFTLWSRSADKKKYFIDFPSYKNRDGAHG